MRRTDGGTVGGWSLNDGEIAKALSACVYADNLADVPSDDQSRRLVPYLGFANADQAGQDRIQQADTGATDNSTPYRAYGRTKPFVVGDLLHRMGVRAAAVMAEAASGSSVAITAIRDHGKESVTRTASLTPTVAGETRVVVDLDSLALSSLRTLAVEFGDTAPSSGTWALDQMAFQLRPEEGV
jgi:hypothetical protein